MSPSRAYYAANNRRLAARLGQALTDNLEPKRVTRDATVVNSFTVAVGGQSYAMDSRQLPVRVGDTVKVYNAGRAGAARYVPADIYGGNSSSRGNDPNAASKRDVTIPADPDAAPKRDVIGLDATTSDAYSASRSITWSTDLGVIIAYIMGRRLNTLNKLELVATSDTAGDTEAIELIATNTAEAQQAALNLNVSGDLLVLTGGTSQAERLVVNSEGYANISSGLRIGDSGMTDPTEALEVVGNVQYTGELVAVRNSTIYTGSIFVPLTAPLTSTAWDGDSRSTTAKTLIDLSAVFGAPAGIKAVYVSVACRDAASAGSDCGLCLSPNNTAGSGVWASPLGVTNGVWKRDQLIVPCDANGDIYYQVIASGTNLFDAYLQIWGYWL